ncbi:TRAP transporter substrate-binding protein DctP [Salicibibacter cibi]|uniref:TRAP transporter substrate-binding protein DctP n=1 Tax=Salicibibacter cibi TaxID=2743001 RepID=A0A7T7CEB3_9BACI|nr:TRAP transporter substrate-binding protein DctP [Salicibibacter cibi]QQK78857.1 TRAP transporter substrate-binding protein DctP [Salicibibacter cibi]
MTRYILLILLFPSVMIIVSYTVFATFNEDSFDEDVHEIIITYPNNPNEPPDLKAQKWKELAEERSEGRLQITLFPSEQLGAPNEIIEMAMAGNNMITGAGFDVVADYAADLGVFDAPYMTEDLDEALYLTETEWFEEQEEELAERGVAIANPNSPYGARHLMTSEEVKTPEDLQGMRIRVPETAVMIRGFAAMGASPTATPLDELYPSLEQGVVDGAENPLPVLEGANVHEAANYLTLTGHNNHLNPWVTGTEMMDNLPDDLVQILKETGYEAGEYVRDILEEQEETLIEEFEEEGIIINEIDEEAFEEEAKSFYENPPGWSDGLYERIDSILEDYRESAG